MARPSFDDLTAALDAMIDASCSLLPPGFVTFEQDEAEQMEEAHP
jgi:hypothetical protein